MYVFIIRLLYAGSSRHYVLFSQNGAIAAAVFQAWRASSANSGQAIALPSSDPDSDPNNDPDKPSGEASDNPLATVDVPLIVRIVIFGLSVGGSIAAAFIFMVSILSHLPLLDGPGAEVIVSLSLAGIRSGVHNESFYDV